MACLRASTRNMRLFLLQIYAYSFFDELIFIYPLYAVMFADYGLSALQISLLFTAWSLTGFVLEIPSGTLADKYSRKHLLLGAQLVRILGFGCWMLHPTFWGFMTGFVCWGISGAFCSGTFQALVFDELKQFGREHAYGKVIGRTRSISLIAILLASALASPMARFGYAFLISAGLVSMMLSCVPILFIRPAKKAKSTGETDYFSLLKQGVGEAIRNRVIRNLMVFTCFALVIGVLDEYWPILGRTAGLPRHMIPLFMGAICAVEACASAVAHRFERLSHRHFYAAYTLAGALLLVTSLVMRPASLLLIPVFTFLLRVSDIVFEAKVQHAISVEARATVLSVKGFFTEAGVMPVFFGFGVVAGGYGYQAGFGIYAVIMIFIGMIYLAFGHTTKGKHEPVGPGVGEKDRSPPFDLLTF